MTEILSTLLTVTLGVIIEGIHSLIPKAHVVTSYCQPLPTLPLTHWRTLRRGGRHLRHPGILFSTTFSVVAKFMKCIVHLIVWFWIGDLISLGFNFLICKREIITVSTLQNCENSATQSDVWHIIIPAANIAEHLLCDGYILIALRLTLLITWPYVAHFIHEEKSREVSGAVSRI